VPGITRFILMVFLSVMLWFVLNITQFMSSYSYVYLLNSSNNCKIITLTLYLWKRPCPVGDNTAAIMSECSHRGLCGIGAFCTLFLLFLLESREGLAHAGQVLYNQATSQPSFFWVRISLCSPGWPRTHCVIQAVLKLMILFPKSWDDKCPPLRLAL
jgi:hypothetical protein